MTGVLVLLAGSGPTNPQQPALIADDPACAACTVRLTQEVLLGWDSEVDLCVGPLLQVFIERDSQARWIVGPTCDPWEVAVFSPEGELVGRLGRYGSGPGEIQAVANLWVDAAGTIHVVDIDRTIHLYSPSFEHSVADARVPLNTMQPIAVFPDGATVHNVVRVDPSRGAAALHVVSTQQEFLASFDTADPYRHDRPQDHVRWMAVSGDRIWSSHFATYRIDVWQRDGRWARGAERAAPWFHPREDADDRAGSFVASLRVDSGDRAWVLGSNPQGTLPHNALITEELVACSPPSQTRDTFVEILDLQSGRVEARAATDFTFMRWVGDRLVNLCSSHDGQYEGLLLWRVELEAE